jgi:hypothetical protein
MQKRLLRTADEWNAWTALMIRRGIRVGYYSPPSFPCVVVWEIQHAGLRDSPRCVLYEFVEKLDFGGPDSL